MTGARVGHVSLSVCLREIWISTTELTQEHTIHEEGMLLTSSHAIH